MRPERMLIFGNPKAGTPLMQAVPASGLDLPLKVLVWEDAQGRPGSPTTGRNTSSRAMHSLPLAANLAGVIPSSRVWRVSRTPGRIEGPFSMLRLLRLWRSGAKDLRLLWYALRHPERPLWLLPVAALLALYALDPANLAAAGARGDRRSPALPLLLHFVARFLPAGIRYDFGRRSLVG